MQHSRGAGSRDPQNVLSSVSVSAQDSRGGSTTSAQRLADGSNHHPSHHHPAAGLPMSQHGYVQVIAPPAQYSPVIQSGTAAARLQHAGQHTQQQSAPVSSSSRRHHHTNSADMVDRKKRSAGAGLVNNVPSSLVWHKKNTKVRPVLLSVLTTQKRFFFFSNICQTITLATKTNLKLMNREVI